MPNELKSIKGVEVFSAGVWNGDKYTVEDLDEMVRAFEETGEHVRPFIKLGHSKEQKLLQNDGLPAAGWIGRLYRVGEKLFADFVDIPKKIHALLEKKAYRKVSSEVYWDVKIHDKKYKYMLGAVALLGADTPGVMNLNDILAMYGLKDFESIKVYAENENEVTVKSYDFVNEDLKEEDPMPKTEREIELEAQLAQEKKAREQFEGEVKKFKSDHEEANQKLKEAQEKAKAAEERAYAAEQKARTTEIERQADELVSEKLITKGMRPYVLQLLGDEPKDEKGEIKKYSFKAGDKDVELSKFELVKELAKLFAKKSDVNFDENSLDGDKERNKLPSEADIEKYAKENKVEFSVAYRELLRGKITRDEPESVDDDGEE